MPDEHPAHAADAVDPVEVTYMPAAHPTQAFGPVADWYWPTEHFAHALVLASVDTRSDPAAQPLHEEASVPVWFWPAVQLTHANAPPLPACRSAEHAMSAIAEVAPAKRPAAQRENTVDATAPVVVEYVPTPHAMQLLTWLCAANISPLSVRYVSPPQAVHADVPVLEAE